MKRPSARRKSAGFYDSIGDIVAHAPAFVFYIDRDGLFLYSNRRFTGALIENPEGKLLEQVLPPERSAAVRALMKSVSASGRPRSRELQIHRSPGRPWSFLVTLGPYFAEGRLCGYVGVGLRLASEEVRPADAEAAKRAARLTPKQRETLILVAEGLSSREIGRRLGVSERTVETHREQLMDRLEIRGVAALARFAAAAGLL